MFEYKNESLYKTCLDKLYLSYYKQGSEGFGEKKGRAGHRQSNWWERKY